MERGWLFCNRTGIVKRGALERAEGGWEGELTFAVLSRSEKQPDPPVASSRPFRFENIDGCCSGA